MSEVRVWDLPVRLCHGLLAVAVAGAFATHYAGVRWFRWHVACGCAVWLAVAFRIAWGVVGGRTARYADFVRGPAAVVRYLGALWRRQRVPQAGHNPLGGWMVLALLLVLGTQASTGLFATDEVLEAGPLAGWVAPAASLRLSSIHRFLQPLVVALVALHVLAVVAHRVLWGHRLAWAIVSGSKPLADVPDGTPPVHWRAGRAVVIAIALSAALFAVVRAAPAMRWPSGFD